MFFVRMLRETLNILCGLAGLYFTIVFGAEPWVGALSLGLVLWGLYEIQKEIRDRRPSGAVAQVAEEQDAIRSRLEAESGSKDKEVS